MVGNTTLEHGSEYPPEDNQLLENPTTKDSSFHWYSRIIYLGLGILLIVFGSYYVYLNRYPSQNSTSKENQVTLAVDRPVTSQPEPSNIPAAPQAEEFPKNVQKNIHLYPAYELDSRISINKLHVVSLLFVPKDIHTPIKSEWHGNMEKIGSNIKTFFEKEFDNKIAISYEVLEEPVAGDLDISNYTAQSLTYEAHQKTMLHKKENYYTILMIYLVRDPEFKKNIIGGNLGGLPQQSAATQYEYWLDTDMINSVGLIGSMHEFGHALGIPHPWELPANKLGDPNFGNVPGDLMGYTSNGVEIDNLYIREDVKQVMGY